MRHPDGPQTKEEKDWETTFVKDQIMQDGYRTQQATKPQTLSYGMMDSPVGVAAWIIEKFYFWSDLKNNNIENSKLIIFKNCAHNVHLEQPDQFNKTIKDFLL